jgi:DNA-directed RNA polymerase specialized sigma24 family protein
VLAARGDSPEARAALGDLCAAYYAPVHAFIRRGARDDDAARDATQEFFAQLLAKGGLATLEQGRGRFRSFLLGAVKHFLADQSDRARAAKRGSGVEPLPLAPATDTSPGLEVPDVAEPPPDLVFDRQWAFTLLERAVRQLGEEFVAAGKGGQFETLKPWLTGEPGTPQSDAAARLGLNENAVKVAIHRLRRRFRELVKAEIAQTVADPAEQRAELDHLIRVLAR